MNISEKYEFSVNGFTAHPVNNALSWSWKREKERIFYEFNLETPLKLQDNPKESRQDFTNLYRLERNRNTRCEELDCIINMVCEGASEDWFNGKIHLMDGDWNVSDCNVDIKPRAKQPWQCILDNYEAKINMLNPVVPRVTVNLYQGTIQFAVCHRSHTTSQYVPYKQIPLANDCIQPNQGWTMYINIAYKDPVMENGNVTWTIDTTYVREFLPSSQTPKGDGWTSVSGGWARPAAVTDPVFEVIAEYTYQEISSLPPAAEGFDNGVTLKALLEFMLQEISCSNLNIISNFFAINEDGTSPINDVYIQAADKLYNMVLFQKTDIKDPGADTNATIAMISFKELFEDLQKMFNVYWLVDDDNNLRIEHITYFNEVRMLNLLETPWEDRIKKQWKYSYESNEYPRGETWKWPDKASDDFNGTGIFYSGSCVSREQNERDKNYQLEQLYTDVTYLISGKDKTGNDGIVIIAAPDGYIFSEVNKWSREFNLNGHLSWPNLLHYYHQYNRPQKKGTLNGQVTVFKSIKRTRKQTIVIPFACCDILQFRPQDLVKTQLGWGEIESATYDDPNQILTLNLLHD